MGSPRAGAASLHDSQQVFGLWFPDAAGRANGHFHDELVDGGPIGIEAGDFLPRHAWHPGGIFEQVVNHRGLEQHRICHLVIEQNSQRADLVPEDVAALEASDADQGGGLDDVGGQRDAAEGLFEGVHGSSAARERVIIHCF